MVTQDAFNRRIKKLARRMEVREAQERYGRGESLPGDDELLREGAERQVRLVTAQHLREKRKYEALPPEERLHFDMKERRFYRIAQERYEMPSGTWSRRPVRYYLTNKPQLDAHALFAMTQAVSEAEAEEESRLEAAEEEVKKAARAYLSMIGRRGGLIGGKAKSAAKTRAARANAKLPRKKKIF